MKSRSALSRRRDHLLVSITAPPAMRGYAAEIESMLRAAHPVCKSHLRELSVALVNDVAIRDVHKRFLKTREITDVITFPLEFDGAGRVIGGEIVICHSQARRHAKQLRTTVTNELLLYALHGLLHLSGWDDRTAAQYRRIHRREDAILQKLGFGPVFEPRIAKGRR